MLKEWMEELTINELDLEVILNKFDITKEDFITQLEDGNINTFSSYNKFFYWMWHDYEVNTIIDRYLTDGNLDPDEEQYVQLDNGKIVFMFL